MSTNLISLLFLVLMASQLLSALVVPQLQDAYFQLTPMGDNKYFLRIYHLDSTVREENVEEVAPGELRVMGKLDQSYADGQLTLVYEAGRQGYIAKYKYTQHTEPQYGFALSASALKSGAG